MDCRTEIWAHRGASGYAPENTMEAFLLAAEQGADGVELDVQMTADGKLVVIHDETIDRVSNGSGRVMDYTLDGLRRFQFNRTHPGYGDAAIPTLEEVCHFLKPLRLMVNIELKTGIIWYEGLEKAAVRLIRELEMEEQVIFSSFNHRSIARVRELAPRMHTAILFSDVMTDTAEYARRLGAEALHPCICQTKMKGLMEEWEESGLDVNVWTVNEPDDMKYLMERGVHAIITNYPDRAFAVRRELNTLRK